jgi:pyruvate/2-oxoglutarate dehydrogenase complex dihydrolipoamide acyltransferase (E2) component
MPTPVKMPRLGESVAEGTVGSWLKQEGDWVEKDESLAEIITDKINAELPSPVAGRLAKILVQPDQTVAVGVDIALIEENADVSASPHEEGAPGPDAAPVEQPTQTNVAVMDRPSAEGSDGSDRAGRSGGTGNGARAAQTAAAPTPPAPSTAPAHTSQTGDEERQRISPLARRLAREHGLDLNDIAGTGIGGRVRKEDILAYVAQQQTAPKAAPAPAAPVAPPVAPRPIPAPAPMPVAAQQAAVPVAQAAPSAVGADEELVEPSRMRLAIAEHMVRSKHTSPHATTVVEVDMTNIAKWLEKNKEEFKRREGYSISYVPFVMKAVCEGLRKFPYMNASWTADNKIILKKRINLGMAVATDAGLVVPTIYDADQYTLAALARQVNAVAQRARANKLTIQDMTGSTFVVNNPGTFGTIISVPIINQPHAGIISMDSVVKRPVVIEDDAIAVRSMMYLCLSFDHRINDGAGAGGFLQAVRQKLQSYGREIDVY